MKREVVGIGLIVGLMIFANQSCITAPPYPDPPDQSNGSHGGSIVCQGGSGTGQSGSGTGQGGSATSSSSSGSPSPDICGDGIRGPSEMCDDHNIDPNDACTPDCKCGYDPPIPLPDDGAQLSGKELIAFQGDATECYVLFAQRKPRWWVAETLCKGLSMHLAAITTKDEFDKIKSFVWPTSSSPIIDINQPFWIGGRRKAPESTANQWLWTNGEQWNESLWCEIAGEPGNDPDPTDCVAMSICGFHDNKCDEGRFFLCEGHSL